MSSPEIPENESAQNPEEISAASAIFSVIAAIPAGIIAVILWPLSLLLLKDGAGPIGGAEPLALFVFWAPVVLVFLPKVFQAFSSGSVAIAAWLIALAPLFGGLNIALVIVICGMFGLRNENALTIVQLLLIGLWVLPLIPTLLNLAKKHD